ncbi:hypothetical protein [Mycolicibacterium iranicum]|uniref:Uncharacterized protein n=1 Tax=Mycolicibacterium iranicum TaxID=912594 RepID=A0A178M0R8_MYCIR|nr:hypothetical protein [Mycolicibacterium iranicum]OAN41496.1 hypothetical protein A4X20_12880 [Mycolicibacterium iranicum]
MTTNRSITAMAVCTSAALLTVGVTGVAHAQPAAPLPAPLPIDGSLAPGLPAMQSLGPVIQQAASDPTNAASMLMAAAAVFAGDMAAPQPSRDVASAVNTFVAQPVAHVPAAGAVPGVEAHLPAGINPANAVGPVEALPEVAHAPAAVEPAAVPAPGAAPGPAPGPLPGPEVATPVSVPAAAVPAPVPAAAPAPGAPTGLTGPNAPVTQDFLYPSISNGCLADGGNVLAAAISVAGPAAIPLPGPGPGQTAYVFTAIGTPGPAAEQKLPLNATWVNLTTGKSGSVTLKPRPDLNPQGPTTLTAIADTGSGSIMSTIFGQVTTTEKQCQFMPTIGSTVVP